MLKERTFAHSYKYNSGYDLSDINLNSIIIKHSDMGGDLMNNDDKTFRISV